MCERIDALASSLLYALQTGRRVRLLRGKMAPIPPQRPNPEHSMHSRLQDVALCPQLAAQHSGAAGED